MESAQATVIKYIIKTQVVKVEEKFDKVHVEGVGGEAKFMLKPKGWFAFFKGSYEAVHLGYEKPNATWTLGKKIKITIEEDND